MRNIILFLLLIFHKSVFSQTLIPTKDSEVIHKFFSGYNNNDYKLMRNNLFLVGRVILNEKKLKNSLTPLKVIYGNFKILNIEQQAPKNYIVNVLSDRDTTEIEKIEFQLNSFHKIQSFSLIYPENNNYEKNLVCNKNFEKLRLLDSLINYKNNYGNYNGSVAILHNNELFFKKTIGLRNYSDKTLLNDSSIYYLGSISKQITAMAILILMEQGKLKHDNTLQKYFPNFPYKNITIENLITHTSGLPDYMEFLESKNPLHRFTNLDVLDFLINRKPKRHFKPSAKFDYSNTGYVLLALIIEKCSGMNYPDFIKQNIFLPLEMNHSTVNGASFATGSKIENWAFGHTFSDSSKQYEMWDLIGDIKNLNAFDLIYGDGNVNCSIDDFIKWEMALRNNVLIAKEITDKMFSNISINGNKKFAYGYGNFVTENDTFQKQVFHGGTWPGHTTLVYRLIESDITVIIMSNNGYPNTIPLCHHVCKILFEA